MSQGFAGPSFVTRTQSEPNYPTDVVFGKDRLGLRYAVLTQQHMEGGSESVSPFGDSARGGSSARCTECSSQADPADLLGGLHSPLDQASPQSSGRSMHDPFREHAPAAAGRHMAGSPHMFAGVEAQRDAGDLPTFEDIQRRLQAAISSQDAFGGRHPSSPPVFRTSSTAGTGFVGAPIGAARHRRSHSADGREINKGLRVISHDLDLSAVAAESRALYAPSDEIDMAAAFGSLQLNMGGCMEGLPRGQFASGQLPPLQYQPPPVMRQPMPDQQWLPALQVGQAPGAMDMEQLLQAAAEQGAAQAEAKLAQQWQALVTGLDPQSLAQYLHNMQLLTTEAASDGGAGVGWLPQRDAGSPQLPPYMAQAAAGQLGGGGRSDRGLMMSDGASGGNTAGSLFGLPPEQQQFAPQPRQPARLKAVSPGVGWLGTAEAAGVLGRMTPAFESPRSVDSAPVSPGPDLMRRYAGGGSATPPFPTPVFPTPARFSPQPSPRGGSAAGGHRAATAPVHPSPLAHSSGSGSGSMSGLETPPLPQSTGTGFFCPAVSATAPRSRGARSNRQRTRDGPAATIVTSDAGKSDNTSGRRRKGSRRSLESDLSRSVVSTAADTAGETASSS